MSALGLHLDKSSLYPTSEKSARSERWSKPQAGSWCQLFTDCNIYMAVWKHYEHNIFPYMCAIATLLWWKAMITDVFLNLWHNRHWVDWKKFWSNGSSMPELGTYEGLGAEEICWRKGYWGFTEFCVTNQPCSSHLLLDIVKNYFWTKFWCSYDWSSSGNAHDLRNCCHGRADHWPRWRTWWRMYRVSLVPICKYWFGERRRYPWIGHCDHHTSSLVNDF